MKYELHITFLYYSIFGKTALSSFKGGQAKRKLKKGVKAGEKKGINSDFEIIELEQDNIKWVLKSDNLNWLKKTEDELTNGVNEKLKSLTGKPIFEKAKRIKSFGIGQKIAEQLTDKKINNIANKNFDMIFSYYKDGKEIEQK